MQYCNETGQWAAGMCESTYNMFFVIEWNVSVNWTCIIIEFIRIKCTDHHVYFDILDELITQGVPYDYYSIMHYEYFAASKNNLPTMLPLNPNIRPKDLGSASLPTEYDYLHINLLYCQGDVEPYNIHHSLGHINKLPVYHPVRPNFKSRACMVKKKFWKGACTPGFATS